MPQKARTYSPYLYKKIEPQREVTWPRLHSRGWQNRALPCSHATIAWPEWSWLVVVGTEGSLAQMSPFQTTP